MTQKNQLQFETSPYLLQHANNPVNWQPWGDETLALARKQNKPILLSIGYAACHWCHVMAHESFENEQIATLMNRHFVNIKVDREERPDLDHIYQSALSMTGQAGGWPLTMFCTPEGLPFVGGTYFPPTSRFGRPGFADVLVNVATLWQNEPENIRKNVEALQAGLRSLAVTPPADPKNVHLSTLDDFAIMVLKLIDIDNGGLSGAPKFPNTGHLEGLWRGYLRTGNKDMKWAVTRSLQHMTQGGIYDHLGGGFARYSVDARWLVPHFEKMLYDNAQLIRLMTLVWQDTCDPLLAQRIEETVDWVLREMRGEKVNGHRGFASTLDADSEGQEGKFYVWRKEELDKVLGEDQSDLFRQIYDVSSEGNWENHIILNRLNNLKLLDADKEAQLAQARAKLFRTREKRVRPGWDDKILADWNGLMIQALAQAGRALGRDDWIEAARDAFRFVTTVMMLPDGQLFHAWRLGKRRHNAMLEDYANMALAALMLYETTGDESYLTQARLWLDILERDFADADHGGYFQTSRHSSDVCVRIKPIADQSTPSGNGVMTDVLARLMVLDPEGDWAGRLAHQIGAFAGHMDHNMFGLASFLNGAETGLRARHVHTEGPHGNVLVRVMQTFSAPDLVWTNKQKNGEPRVTVCLEGVCLPPVNRAQELIKILVPALSCRDV